MKLFFSAGEPSGDVHTASLMHELRAQCPEAEFTGFGGPHMQAAGCRLLFPLADYPVIGIVQALAGLRRFIGLSKDAGRHLRDERPDAVVLVDYPGFNWHIARRAKSLGIPVFYFLPPQVWAWATWRVKKMRRLVDHVLCMFPFEVDWYRQRGVPATLVGHPYFDELLAQQLDGDFLAEHSAEPDSPVIGILPGSRTAEVQRNFPICVRAAERIAREFPKARFPVACFREQHRPLIETHIAASRLGDQVRPYVGRTAEIIRASDVCMAKSGSVSLELLFHTKPSTIMYQISKADYPIYRTLRALGVMAAPYIALVNILAGRELFPEFLTCADVSAAISERLMNWLRDSAACAQTVAELAKLKRLVAQPGAVARTAQYILEHLAVSTVTTRRAA